LKLAAYYIHPRTTLPTELPSDTIAGAILHSMAHLYGEEAVVSAAEDRAFTVSSGFPYLQRERIEHFLPKPQIPLRPRQSQNASAKKLKKARFVHHSIFQRISEGVETAEDLIDKLEKGEYTVRSNLLLPAEIQATGIVQIKRPGNLINRKNGRSENFYHTTQVYYYRAGMYFLARCKNRWRRMIEASLRLLKDRGLGGDISSGSGSFQFTQRDFTLPSKGEYFTNLSLYLPTEEELAAIEQSPCWYTLRKRRGRDRHGALKKRIFLFEEGSVFKATEHQGCTGSIAWVGEKNLEWGLTITAGIHMEGELG
jgi:CRISPR type III-A-associated RAMP protein Csm4